MYNPNNWYWIVGGSTTQVFSSFEGKYVPINDSLYQSWLNAGNIPTLISTDGELTDVLINAGIPWSLVYGAGQTNLGVLENGEAVNVLLVSGINITSTSTPSLNGIYALDTNSVNNLNGLFLTVRVGDGFPEGASTFEYVDISGNPHSFDETHFLAFCVAVRNYLYTLNQAGNSNGPWPSNDVTII